MGPVVVAVPIKEHYRKEGGDSLQFHLGGVRNPGEWSKLILQDEYCTTVARPGVPYIATVVRDTKPGVPDKGVLFIRLTEIRQPKETTSALTADDHAKALRGYLAEELKKLKSFQDLCRLLAKAKAFGKKVIFD